MESSPSHQSGAKGRLNLTSTRGHPRKGASLQQAPDFLTDSLNTTFIPSPSPKPRSHHDLQAKLRQRLERHSLASTYRARTNTKKENERPQLNAGSDQESHKKLQRLRKPEIHQPKIPVLRPKSPQRSNTPPPPRSRADSIQSPESESSPPHGYAEAYQRIGEETDLADSIDDTDLISFAYPNDEDDQQGKSGHKQSRHRSRSPGSPRASRPESPRSALAQSAGEMNMSLDKGSEPNHNKLDPGLQEDTTQSSHGSGSSQYTKDVDRVNKILNGQSHAFSKARHGDRTRLIAENLRRTTGSNESLRSALGAGSLTRRSDPSLNVPKQWGRNAKPSLDLFKRVNGSGPRQQASVSLNAHSPDARVGDVSLATASSIPLPDSSSSTNSSSQCSTPRNAHQRNTTTNLKPSWNFGEDDFTGRSLQASESPPIRQGGLNRDQEEEIERLEKRAVTTSRLGDLKGRVSVGTLRRKSLGLDLQDMSTDGQDSPATRKDSVAADAKLPTPTSNTGPAQAGHKVEDLGEPIPDTPIIVYRKGAKSGGIESEKSSRGIHESHNLLRRLSRATSDTPSSKDSKSQVIELTDGELSEIEQKPALTKTVTEQPTPRITGAWVDQTLQSIAPQTAQKPNLKTPKVMGGWIETPLPTVKRSVDELQAPDPNIDGNVSHIEQDRSEIGKERIADTVKPATTFLKYSGPALPKSALEQIVQDAKSGKKLKATQGSDTEDEQTMHLGNSTIQSLEDLIENDTDLPPTPPSQGTTPPSSDPSPSSKAKSKSENHSEDPDSYAGLLSRLTNLGPSLRASKRQIASLERTVSNTSSKAVVKKPEEECHEGGELHDFLWPCERCGCPGGRGESAAWPSLITIRNFSASGITTVTIPIPRLWSWRRNDWRPRLTWLGTTILSIYFALVLESWARYNYCHPLYASSMVGYGVDIDAPEPPFVFFKVLYQASSIENVLHPLYIYSRAALRIFAALFTKFLDAFIGFRWGSNGQQTQSPMPDQATAEIARQPVSSDSRIPRPQWGPDLSMMNDEFL